MVFALLRFVWFISCDCLIGVCFWNFGSHYLGLLWILFFWVCLVSFFLFGFSGLLLVFALPCFFCLCFSDGS